ncbi:MAG: FkbM family methyltransferase [Pseudomonadota bacterium]
MKKAHLPSWLWPKAGAPLERFGRNHDGGYLVDRRCVADTKKLVSFGLWTDWSFEADFLSQNDVPLAAYDGSISPQVLLHQILQPAGRLHVRTTLRAIRTLVSYSLFFRPAHRTHHRAFVGHESGPNWVTPDAVFASELPAKQDRAFLKIDIEGSEYDVLDGILAIADRLEGLVIEFHDLADHLSDVHHFVDRLPLHLCHTHICNFGIVTKQGVPTVIECSFTRHPLETRRVEHLPHPLDQPNSTERPDIDVATEASVS